MLEADRTNSRIAGRVKVDPCKTLSLLADIRHYPCLEDSRPERFHLQNIVRN